MRIVNTLLAVVLLGVLSFIAYDLHRIATVIYQPTAYSEAMAKLTPAQRRAIHKQQDEEMGRVLTDGLFGSLDPKPQAASSKTK